MRKKALFVLSVLLFIGAAVITAYPMIANYINDKYQSAIRTEYAQEIEGLDDSKRQEARKVAIAYNESLLPIQYDREALQAAAVKNCGAPRHFDAVPPVGFQYDRKTF